MDTTIELLGQVLFITLLGFSVFIFIVMCLLKHKLSLKFFATGVFLIMTLCYIGKPLLHEESKYDYCNCR